MRSGRPIVDTGTQDWEIVNATLSRKVLNGHAADGPHTMILRSAPRVPNLPGGQYHHHDEEFFCLEGDFTFDGACWFGPGGYGYFAASVVHGAAVYVRGGYELFLRNGGAGAVAVDRPLCTTPYPLDGAGDAAAAIISANSAADEFPSFTPSAGWTVTRLRGGQGSTSGSMLLQADGGAATSGPLALRAEGLLELFAIAGQFSLRDGELFGSRCYSAISGADEAVTIRCMDSGSMFVSHEGALTVSVPGHLVQGNDGTTTPNRT